MTGKFLSRWYTTPHRENTPRTQCLACQGGGDINDLRCPECGGTGYFDANNPPRSKTAKTRTTTRKGAIW